MIAYEGQKVLKLFAGDLHSLVCLFQIYELNEKLRSEQDSTSKIKKTYGDLQQRYSHIEKGYQELHSKLNEALTDKNQLESQLRGLNQAFESERSARSQGSDQISDLESEYMQFCI